MDPSRQLPEFVRSHFSSVWALELLLLLRVAPDRAWSVPEITGELRATPQLVSACLEHLVRGGLVAGDKTGYRYAPANPVLAGLSDSLAAEYRERPVRVVNLIVAPADRLQQLADAFRFKPEGDR